jgi:ABC-type transport system involved in multi-copper enzyme maturation permease subunit
MRRQQIVTLAHFTVLEAWRTRLPWLFAIALALVFAAAGFIQQLAITDSARMLIAFSAATTRLIAVFVLSLHVLTSIVRELDDKGLELTLSFDLRRCDFIFGRLLGFALIAVVIALLAALPQLMLTPQPAALQWGLSLALELVMMAALSVFSIVTFTRLMPAATFVGGFYLFARSLSALRLIGDAPIAGGDTPSHQLIARCIDALALLVPAFDRFTQSAWLVDGAPGWSFLGGCAAQAALYSALLGAAAMFDFYRRNL